MIARVGGWGALASVWALTAVPAALTVYIIRNVFVERWPGTPVTAVMEGPMVAIGLWAVLSALLTAWGAGASRRR